MGFVSWKATGGKKGADGRPKDLAVEEVKITAQYMLPIIAPKMKTMQVTRKTLYHSSIHERVIKDQDRKKGKLTL